jgi:nicotinate phosphoribosyltransferase
MEAQLDALDPTYQRLLNPHIYKVSLTQRLTEIKRAFIEDRLARN